MEREAGSLGNRGDVPVRHLGTKLVTEIEDRGGEYDKIVRPLPLGHLCYPDCLVGAVLIETPHTTGTAPADSSRVMSRLRCCSSKVSVATSEAWALVVMPATPGVSIR